MASRRALLLLGALAGCQNGGVHGEQPLAVTLEFSPTFTCGNIPECFSPDGCPLDCGGEVGLFLVDAQTDEVIDEQCVSFDAAAGTKLRSLTQLIAGTSLGFDVAPGRQVALEIAVFSPLSLEGECPRVFDSGDGTPPATKGDGMLPGESPAYFGRSAPFTLRAGVNDVLLPISCALPQECGGSSNQLDAAAFVVDMDTLFAPVPAEGVDVRLIELRAADNTRVVLDLWPELMLVDPKAPEPLWQRAINDASVVIPDDCVGTLVTKVAPSGAFSVASCAGDVLTFGTPGMTSQSATATGYAIDKADVDAIFAALGLPASVPADGMLIGRVVQGASPVAGATVRPLNGGVASVVYVEIDGAGAPMVGTTASFDDGWFVVMAPPALQSEVNLGQPAGARCCESFLAESETGQIGCSLGPLGLIEGALMGGLVDLDFPCPQPP